MSEPDEPRDFFISFNKADRPAATWIAWVLEKIGTHRVYFQDWDFRGNFVDHMNEGVKKCPRCVAVLSDNYFASGFTLAEWSAYFARDPANRTSTIIPVRVGTISEENLLAPQICADLTDCDEATAEARLLDHIKKAIDPDLRPIPDERPPFWQAKAKPAFPHLTKTRATHNLPPRNPDFVGREAALDAIQAALVAPDDQPLVVTQAITGLGGVGKTQIALAYAHRQLVDCDLVWWLNAETPAKLAADYAGMARPLGIAEAADEAALNRDIRNALQASDGWLLVFDNVEARDAIRPYLPASGAGRVLITSRRSDWHGLARTLPLDIMSKPEALRLLTGRDDPPSSLIPADLAEAEALAEDLGYLPLALAQARAFMAERGHGVAAYRKLFAERLVDVMARGADGLDPTIDASADPDARRRQRAVAATWDISIEAAEAAAPGARELLQLLACFAPDPLPRDVLAADASALPEPLRDDFAREDALAALARLSLVDATGAGITCHRLVQAITRASLKRTDPDAAGARAGSAVRLLLSAMPEHESYDHRSWGHHERMLAQYLAATDHAEAIEAALPSVAGLLNEAATYLNARASHAEAEPLWARAIALGENMLGPMHSELATWLNNLATLCQATGRYDEAEALYVRAIAITEKTLGPEHPHLATRLNNLAELYRTTEHYDQAEPLYARDIAITKKTLGSDHPDLAIGLNNLANFYRATGRYKDAEPLFDRAIAITEKALGPKHSNLGFILSNLALLYQDTGRDGDAVPLYMRAIDIGEKTLGPQHPDLATWLKNLAVLYENTGRHDEAEPLFERAIAIIEAALPADHPHQVLFRDNYARLLDALDRHDEAEELRARAQTVRNARAAKGNP